MKKILFLFAFLAICLTFQGSAVYASSDGETAVESQEGMSIGSLWEKAKEIFLDIWNQAGVEETEEEPEEDRIFISQHLKAQIFLVVVMVALGLLFLYLLISFLRSSWKEKLHSLIILALTILIAGGIFAAIWYSI